jgi:hypothetical protein
MGVEAVRAYSPGHCSAETISFVPEPGMTRFSPQSPVFLENLGELPGCGDRSDFVRSGLANANFDGDAS